MAIVSPAPRSRDFMNIIPATVPKKQIPAKINCICALLFLNTRGLLVLVRCSSEVHNAIEHQHTRRNYQGKNYHWMHWQEGYQRPCDEVPSDRPSHSEKLFHRFLLPGCILLKLKLSHEICGALAWSSVVNGGRRSRLKRTGRLSMQKSVRRFLQQTISRYLFPMLFLWAVSWPSYKRQEKPAE